MFDWIKEKFDKDAWRRIERKAKERKWQFVAELKSFAFGLADDVLLMALDALLKLAIERGLRKDGDS